MQREQHKQKSRAKREGALLEDLKAHWEVWSMVCKEAAGQQVAETILEVSRSQVTGGFVWS